MVTERLTTKKVLVVEDNKNHLDIIARFLNKHGFVVIAAKSVEEGVKKLSKYGVDLILLDHFLGDETSEDFLERTKNGTPVILLLSCFDTKVVEKTKTIKDDIECLAKEDIERELIKKIEDLLNKKTTNKVKRGIFIYFIDFMMISFFIFSLTYLLLLNQIREEILPILTISTYALFRFLGKEPGKFIEFIFGRKT